MRRGGPEVTGPLWICDSCSWDVQGLTGSPEGNFLGTEALDIPTLPFQRDSAPHWEQAQVSRACSLSCLPSPAGISPALPLSLLQVKTLLDLQPLPCLTPGIWAWIRAVSLIKAAVGEHRLRALWQLLLLQKLPQIFSFLPSLHSSTSLCSTQTFRALWNFPLSVLRGKG